MKILLKLDEETERKMKLSAQKLRKTEIRRQAIVNVLNWKNHEMRTRGQG